jgi:hypothetical protein
MSIVELEIAGDDAERVRALRLRAADVLEAAYRFLESSGDEWAWLRAQVLCGAQPATRLTERLAAGQADDGHVAIGTLVSGGAPGFPAIDASALTPDERAIVGTLEAILVAADARLLLADWVEPAVRALEARQSEDGTWRVACPTSAEGAELVELFWTGMVAGALGRTPLSRPDGLEAAGERLTARFEPDLVEHEGFGTLLAYAHFFTNVGHDQGDEILQWCGRALEKGFRSRRLDAVSTLRLLLTCDAQAMPGASFDVVELLEGLLAEQAGDGGFAELATGGRAVRTTPTFDAMLAIVRLCAVLED